MPFTRPTLTELRNQVLQDIASALPDSDPLLRFSNLNITGNAQANLAFLHYGYLDWIAKQSVPFTAEGEFLEGWAGVKNIVRKPATSASGKITVTGVAGTAIPVGTQFVRGDGVLFTSTAAATVGGGGTAVINATADADITGLEGAFGNTVTAVAMSLSQSISGINSTGTVTTAFVGGADLEADSNFRTRMLDAYQKPPQGGAQNDYIGWALSVAGVTRAWCTPNGFGVGTVVIYVMLDVSEAAYNGFPQGSDGVATSEARGVTATGDQLLVANVLYGLQPVTALVYVVSPVANPIAFTISDIPIGLRTSVSNAIADVFLRDGSPGASIPLAHVWSAIASIAGVDDFVITTPTADIANATGELPTVGTITWT